jgi:hypothetical protein
VADTFVKKKLIQYTKFSSRDVAAGRGDTNRFRPCVPINGAEMKLHCACCVIGRAQPAAIHAWQLLDTRRRLRGLPDTYKSGAARAATQRATCQTNQSRAAAARPAKPRRGATGGTSSPTRLPHANVRDALSLYYQLYTYIQ